MWCSGVVDATVSLQTGLGSQANTEQNLLSIDIKAQANEKIRIDTNLSNY
jgi:hypothetical protein